jgi:inorganic triphosphatase YgiF
MSAPAEIPKNVRIKFEIASDQIDRLRNHLAQKPHLKEPPFFETRQWVYYDTRDFSVREEGFALRVEAGKESILQLVEAPNGAAYRYFNELKWQNPIEPNSMLRDEISVEILPAPLSGKISGTLRPIFRVEAETKRYVVRHGASEITAIIVDGSASTESRTAGFSEVQLIVDGDQPSDLFAYIRGIDETIPRRLSSETEACRGYRLLDGKNPDFVKRKPVKLEQGMSCAETFRIIAHECMHHIVANEPAMSAGNAEALHQVRIGLRRLRVALSLFAPLCADTQVRTIKSEIKWFAALLGPARDLDVFLSEVMLPLREQYREEPGLLSLQRSYSAQRTKFYDRVSQAAHSIRFRSLVLETAAWIETGLWNHSEGTRSARERPIEAFAVEELMQRRKKVKKRGTDLAELDPDGRHSLRIHVKKLRYTAEFFMSLFPGKKKSKRAFLTSLKNLQTALGDVNDIAVRAGLKADVIVEKKSRVDGQKLQHRAFAAGLIIGHQRAKLGSIVKAAERSYKEFLDAKIFWQNLESVSAPPEVAEENARPQQDLFAGEAA